MTVPFDKLFKALVNSWKRFCTLTTSTNLWRTVYKSDRKT